MDKKTQKLYKSRTAKELMWGMALYTGSSIFGPLVILGLVGYVLDYYLTTSPVFLISGVLLAFVVTNILVFKKLKKLNKEVEEEIRREEKKEGGVEKSKDINNQ